jgi:hypothetical protein
MGHKLMDMLQAAETFLLNNARLLERQLFAYHYRDSSREGVLRALRAYQNDDGGFGQALEPDKRTASSQPIDQEIALRVMDAVGFETDLARQVCNYLLTITTAEGGVPFTLATVNDAPHAPWWHSDDPEPPASLNPTASIAGLLLKHRFEHPWLKTATAYCWKHIEQLSQTEPHGLICSLLFLEQVPQRARAMAAFERLKTRIIDHTSMTPGAEGYVHPPYAFAPSPDSLAHQLYEPELLTAHLKQLKTQQQDDGGWLISHPAISPGCELAYRGIVTLNNLKILGAYGYL